MLRPLGVCKAKKPLMEQCGLTSAHIFARTSLLDVEIFNLNCTHKNSKPCIKPSLSLRNTQMVAIAKMVNSV